MKTIAFALLACLPVFAVGTVGISINALGPQQGPGGLPENRVHLVTITWVGDSVNGTVPSTVVNISQFPQLSGYRLVSIEIQPGTPSPSTNYSITLTDAQGIDLLAGNGANLSATVASYTGSLLSPPLITSPTFNLSGNSVASAKGTVQLYFAPLSQVAAARGLPATLPANNTFTGGNNAFKAINLKAFADQFFGTNACAKINSAWSSLTTTGGIVDATGFATGIQPCTSNPFTGNLLAGQLWLGNSTFQPTVQWSIPFGTQVIGLGRGSAGFGNTFIQAVSGFPATGTIANSPNGATESGNTVTITTTATCGYRTGDSVTIANVGVTAYNGTWTVLTPGCNGGSTFTYTNPTGALGASGGGTVTEPVMLIGQTVQSYGTGAANLTIDAGGIAGIAFQNQLCQEQCRAEHILLEGFTQIGLDIEGGSGSQNAGDYHDIEILGNNEPVYTTATLPVKVNVNSTSFRGIHQMTINFTGANANPAVCMQINTPGTYDNIHLEGCTTGISIGTDNVEVTNIDCAQSNVTTCVNIQSGVQNINIRNIHTLGTNLLVDNVMGHTYTGPGELGFYFLGDGATTNKTRLGSSANLDFQQSVAPLCALNQWCVGGATNQFRIDRGGASGAEFRLLTSGNGNTGLTSAAFAIPESTGITAIAGQDILWGDSTAHQLKMNNNNGGALAIASSITPDPLAGTYRVTTDQTITAGASLTNIPGLSWTFPANTALNVKFTCDLQYSQATAAASDQIGFQDVTVGATNIETVATAYTSSSVFTQAMQNGAPGTGAIGLVTFTPSAAGTTFSAHVEGLIEQPSNASTSTVNIMAQFTTNNGTIKRGSSCQLF